MPYCTGSSIAYAWIYPQEKSKVKITSRHPPVDYTLEEELTEIPGGGRYFIGGQCFNKFYYIHGSYIGQTDNLRYTQTGGTVRTKQFKKCGEGQPAISSSSIQGKIIEIEIIPGTVQLRVTRQNSLGVIEIKYTVFGYDDDPNGINSDSQSLIWRATCFEYSPPTVRPIRYGNNLQVTHCIPKNKANNSANLNIDIAECGSIPKPSSIWRLTITDSTGTIYLQTYDKKPSVNIQCQDSCPPNTCECSCGERICCYDQNGTLVKSYLKGVLT